MTIALFVVAALFLGLLALRVSGARRAFLMAHWPVLLLGAAAVYSLARGGAWPALAFAGAAALLWWLGRAPRRPAATGQSPEEAAARVILGVGPSAGEREIRAAYRAKMARAHPDRGGSAAEAARLTAARDRLLKR